MRKPRQLWSQLSLSSPSGDRYVGDPSALRFYSPKRLELRFVYQSINLSQSCQSRRILAIIVRLVSQPLSQDFSHSIPSRQSGMVQPVVQEMFATVHAAGSSPSSSTDHHHRPMCCFLPPNK
eukprot:scaffold8274_cov136-Isochrysis_galbana.AAC.3